MAANDHKSRVGAQSCRKCGRTHQQRSHSASNGRTFQGCCCLHGRHRAKPRRISFVFFFSPPFLQRTNANPINHSPSGKAYPANATWRADKGGTRSPTKSRETERRGQRSFAAPTQIPRACRQHSIHRPSNAYSENREHASTSAWPC
jgi:hypothetical protein